MRGIPVAMILGLFTLAGCADDAYSFSAHADEARILPQFTWAYDGAGVRNATGTLEVDLNDDTDTGRVRAQVDGDGHRFDVDWRRFEGREAFQQGGIVRSVELHGATGNGSSELPAFFAYAACWGVAELRMDGEVVKDPTTARAELRATLYLLRGHVRDPTHHTITTQNGNAPYDPERPDDVRTNATGAQALLLFRTQTGELWRHFEFETVTITRL